MNAPSLFDQSANATVIVVNDAPSAEEMEAAEDAVDMCPSGALSLSADR